VNVKGDQFSDAKQVQRSKCRYMMNLLSGYSASRLQSTQPIKDFARRDYRSHGAIHWQAVSAFIELPASQSLSNSFPFQNSLDSERAEELAWQKNIHPPTTPDKTIAVRNSLTKLR
jgi:hypothetical protein